MERDAPPRHEPRPHPRLHPRARSGYNAPMSLRPPRLSTGRTPPRTVAASSPAGDPLAASLEQENLAEKLATHSRLVGKLERALAGLEAAEAGTGEHRRRLAAASEAVYHLVVQRDLLRLPDTDRFLAGLGVPAALRARVVPPRIAWRRRRRRGLTPGSH